MAQRHSNVDRQKPLVEQWLFNDGNCTFIPNYGCKFDYYLHVFYTWIITKQCSFLPIFRSSPLWFTSMVDTNCWLCIYFENKNRKQKFRFDSCIYCTLHDVWPINLRTLRYHLSSNAWTATPLSIIRPYLMRIYTKYIFLLRRNKLFDKQSGNLQNEREK